MTFPSKRNILTNQRAQLMNVHAAIAAMRDREAMSPEATCKLGNVEAMIQSAIKGLDDVLKSSLDPGIEYSAPAGRPSAQAASPIAPGQML
jgi:hypothetical protein